MYFWLILTTNYILFLKPIALNYDFNSYIFLTNDYVLLVRRVSKHQKVELDVLLQVKQSCYQTVTLSLKEQKTVISSPLIGLLFNLGDEIVGSA